MRTDHVIEVLEVLEVRTVEPPAAAPRRDEPPLVEARLPERQPLPVLPARS